jgi:hypothetical protein
MKFRQLQSFTETVVIAGFTDGAGTSGYIDLTTPMPANAIPILWEADVTIAFAGDSTAVMELGVAGDVDAFTVDAAPSVQTIARVTSSSLAYVPSSATDRTVRCTITEDDDFTDITTGSMAITMYYMMPDA